MLKKTKHIWFSTYFGDWMEMNEGSIRTPRHFLTSFIHCFHIFLLLFALSVWSLIQCVYPFNSAKNAFLCTHSSQSLVSNGSLIWLAAPVAHCLLLQTLEPSSRHIILYLQARFVSKYAKIIKWSYSTLLRILLSSFINNSNSIHINYSLSAHSPLKLC